MFYKVHIHCIRHNLCEYLETELATICTCLTRIKMTLKEKKSELKEVELKVLEQELAGGGGGGVKK